MINQKKFEEFLKFTSGQKEISLAIAQSEAELKEFQKVFINQDFKLSQDVFELLKNAKENPKNILVIKDKDIKSEYDFLVQYPTGQVELFDHEKMQPISYLPNYQNVSIVFLVTEEILQKLKYYDILSNIGITYREK